MLSQKFNKLSKKKSTVSNAIKKADIMIGDSAWDIMRKRSSKVSQQQQQIQQQLPYSKSHNDSTKKNKLSKLSKKHIKSSTTNIAYQKQYRPSGEVLSQNFNCFHNSNTNNKVRPKTAYSNIKPNLQKKQNWIDNETYTNDRKVQINDEFEVSTETDKFFDLIQNAAESGVKNTIELYFHNLNNQMSSFEHKMKKLITSHEILAAELNNKVTNYGEEHNRKLSQICMKLEYDKLFYQNLNSVINCGGNSGGGDEGGISGKSLAYKRNRSDRKDQISSNRSSRRNHSNRYDTNLYETMTGQNMKLSEPAIDQLQTYCQKINKLISNSNEDDNDEESSTDNNCTKRNSPERPLSKPSLTAMTSENENQLQQKQQKTISTDDINLKHILKVLSKYHYATNNVAQKSSKNRKKSTNYHHSHRKRSSKNNHYSLPSTDDNAGDSNQSSSRSSSLTSIFKNNYTNLSSVTNIAGQK